MKRRQHWIRRMIHRAHGKKIRVQPTKIRILQSNQVVRKKSLTSKEAVHPKPVIRMRSMEEIIQNQAQVRQQYQVIRHQVLKDRIVERLP